MPNGWASRSHVLELLTESYQNFTPQVNPPFTQQSRVYQNTTFTRFHSNADLKAKSFRTFLNYYACGFIGLEFGLVFLSS